MSIIDLTGPISEKMWCYGKPFFPFSRKQISNSDSHGYFSYEYKLFSHMGTHIDSLAHFDSNAPNLDHISLETLYGTAIIIPVENCNPLYEIELSDIHPYLDKVKSNDIVLICTGWDRMWESDDYVSQSPFLSNELSHWLVKKKVKLVGTDTALCCDPREGINFVSENANIPDLILLRHGIPYINGLVNLERIAGRPIQFLALPLKIKSAEGAPVRAIAICEDVNSD